MFYRQAVIGMMILAIASHAAAAQGVRSNDDPIPVGATLIGPALGIGAIGEANFAFGGRVEHIVSALPSVDNGKLGVEVAVDYYAWSGPGYSVSYIPVQASANYHFSLDDPRWDAFMGLGLGYSSVSVRGFGDYRSAPYMAARAGLRYMLNAGWSVQLDAGTGSNRVSAGLMLRL